MIAMNPCDLDALSGYAWVFGDNVSTDEIIAGKRLAERNISRLAQFTFEHLKENFSSRINRGDLIVAGKNFGCGSSREQAVLVLKELGVRIIIARSFGRIFFRNCVNNGILPLRVNDDLNAHVQDNQQIKIDFKNNIIICGTHSTPFVRPPELFFNIWRAGGLINYLKSQPRHE